MADIAPTKWGTIMGPTSTNFSTARDAVTGDSVVSNPTTSQSAIYYQYYGRGALEHAMRRAFFSFNVLSYSNVTSATLQIVGYAFTTAAPLALVSSTAFGTGTTDLSTSDFDALNHNIYYADIINSWSTTTNTITLNSNAISAINSVSYFRCCLLQYNNDNQNTAAVSSTLQNAGIDYGPIILSKVKLTVTSGSDGPSRVNKIGKYEKSQISKYDGYDLSDIASINGVS